ncbi:DUF3148 domain-containing protein [Thermosynechococcaceae cyanobacterium BACA0444]|uniref:DUF3148 domain-containing protein n=1 Tax=Pseudocalidococcus azoricus BACA0444 TaxID=2918990 RepID=A0AAE4FT54_9CYAN|nr:DUF3148 domain-containing protein [Pseudocalidococcus azoricus]MDS3861368.1 DUF3148 domain-containing protein [Pseudocalidococcus azoricus BACA0444]
MDTGTPSDFQAGDQVQLIRLPSYVKTAEPMPMLRPPDVLTLGETGVILGRHPGNYWAVRLGRGAFLLEAQYLAKLETQNSEA